MKPGTWLFLAAWGLFGCGHTETHQVLLGFAPPTGREPEVYLGGDGPGRARVEIAIVQVVGYGSAAKMETIMEAAKARAKALGCDALVRVTVDRGVSKSNAVGVCVKYASEAPPDTPVEADL